MRSLKEIIDQASYDVNVEHFDNENIKAILSKFANSDGKLSDDKLMAATVEIATSYSSNVLYKVLTTMKSEGYFKD